MLSARGIRSERRRTLPCLCSFSRAFAAATWNTPTSNAGNRHAAGRLLFWRISISPLSSIDAKPCRLRPAKTRPQRRCNRCARSKTTAKRGHAVHAKRRIHCRRGIPKSVRLHNAMVASRQRAGWRLRTSRTEIPPMNAARPVADRRRRPTAHHPGLAGRDYGQAPERRPVQEV